MLTDDDKIIAEKFIDLHKKKGGTLTPDSRSPFMMEVKNKIFNIDLLIDKLVTLGLLQYKFSDRTGWTVLTQKGWNFSTFENYDKILSDKDKIDKLTIEKLKTDLLNSKRQSKMFYPLTILTFILGFISIFGTIRSCNNNKFLEQLQIRQKSIDTMMINLKKEIIKKQKDSIGNIK